MKKILILGGIALLLGGAGCAAIPSSSDNSTATNPMNHTQSTSTITKEQAIKIATDDAGGFLGSWVDATLENNQWIVKASSKSANPPVLYTIDATSGKIIDKSSNTDEHNLLTLTKGNKLFSDNQMDFTFEYPEEWTYRVSTINSNDKDHSLATVLSFYDSSQKVRMKVETPLLNWWAVASMTAPDTEESYPTNDPNRPLIYRVWKSGMAYVIWELRGQQNNLLGGQISMPLNNLSASERDISLNILQAVIKSFKFKMLKI